MKDILAYNKIKDLLDKYAGNIAVLEDEINLELQVQYFKESKEHKKELDKESVLNNKELLFDNDISFEEKRALLCKLAAVDDVSAFRTIERYVSQPDQSLSEWAKLAFQESKMLMERTFLDKAPLFISTGLGGKGDKLRYFIVVTSKDYKPLSNVYEKIIDSEFNFAFARNNAEIEDIEFFGYFATITGLIPLEVGLKDLFTGIVVQCNDLGDFLSPSFLVTNVKKLSFSEIEEAIEKERVLKKSE